MRSIASRKSRGVAFSPKACRMRRSCGVKDPSVVARRRSAAAAPRSALLASATRRSRCAGEDVRIESQHLVDELQIPVVVDEALVRRDLGVDTDPEAHVRSSSGGCANGSALARRRPRGSSRNGASSKHNAAS